MYSKNKITHLFRNVRHLEEDQKCLKNIKDSKTENPFYLWYWAMYCSGWFYAYFLQHLPAERNMKEALPTLSKK